MGYQVLDSDRRARGRVGRSHNDRARVDPVLAEGDLEVGNHLVHRIRGQTVPLIEDEYELSGVRG